VSRVAGEMDALRIALGEVGVLATLTAGAFDAEDWVDPRSGHRRGRGQPPRPDQEVDGCGQGGVPPAPQRRR
jgi:hypothetical protein